MKSNKIINDRWHSVISIANDAAVFAVHPSSSVQLDMQWLKLYIVGVKS